MDSGLPAPDPVSMGSPPLFFHHLASCADAARVPRAPRLKRRPPRAACVEHPSGGCVRPENRKAGASAIGWIGGPGRVPEMSPNGHQQPTTATGSNLRT